MKPTITLPPAFPFTSELFVLFSKYLYNAFIPPGYSGICSTTSKTTNSSLPFVFAARFSARTLALLSLCDTFTVSCSIFSVSLNTFSCTISAKSLTLTAEISSTFSEISGRAKAVTAIAANGSTYKYFNRAHGFDFSFNIIVIRFLSLL